MKSTKMNNWKHFCFWREFNKLRDLKPRSAGARGFCYFELAARLGALIPFLSRAWLFHQSDWETCRLAGVCASPWPCGTGGVGDPGSAGTTGRSRTRGILHAGMLPQNQNAALLDAPSSPASSCSNTLLPSYPTARWLSGREEGGRLLFQDTE